MLYAAYNEYVNTRIMKREYPDADMVCSGKIEGHKIIINGRITIEKNDSSYVNVIIWNIPDRISGRFELIERRCGMYHRQSVRVVSDDGRNIDATTYVCKDNVNDRQSCMIGIIKNGYAEHGWKFI